MTAPYPIQTPTYPTEERERQKVKQKAMKEAGLEPRKKKFKMEDHHDDCGNDLSGLGSEIIQYAADYVIKYGIQLRRRGTRREHVRRDVTSRTLVSTRK